MGKEMEAKQNMTSREFAESKYQSLPDDVKSMTKEELALIVSGLSCKVRLIEQSWRHRESFACGAKYKEAECKTVATLFAALLDYDYLSLFEDGRVALESAPRPTAGCVYVIEFADGHIKIGKSSNPIDRIKSIAGGNQSALLRSWISDESISFSRIELAAHKHFASSRVGGEFFAIGYEEAVNWVAGEWAKYQIVEQA